MQENAQIDCPYCGQPLEIALDPSVVAQTYIEDCQICCRPIQIQVRFLDGEAQVSGDAMD